MHAMLLDKAALYFMLYCYPELTL